MFFRIVDVEKAAYAVENLDAAITSVGQSCARSVIGRLEYDRIIGERGLINAELAEVLGKSIESWGVDCTRFELQHFSPQSPEVSRQLEKQMEAERSRRENELNTLARIRTAEGEKSSAILKSEGKMISAQNEATGLAMSITKKAEADAYARELEAKAWQRQIDTLAQSMGCPNKAASFLLEMKRLDHLQSLALGQNAKIYFTPTDGILPTAQSVIDMLSDGKSK